MHDVVEGVIHRVTIRKPGGWGIAMLTVANSKAKITVVGVGIGSLVEGESVRVSGKITHHPTYGKQFAVEGITALASTEHVGIAAAIQSFRGIGKANATRLQDMYNAHGTGTFVDALQASVKPTDVVATWILPGIANLADKTRKYGPRGMLAWLTWLIDEYGVRQEKTDAETGRTVRSGKITSFRAAADVALTTCADTFNGDPYSVLTCKYSFREADALLLKKKIIDPNNPVRLKYIYQDVLTNNQHTIFEEGQITDKINADFNMVIGADPFEDDEAVPVALPPNTKRIGLVRMDGCADRRVEKVLENAQLLRAERATLAGLYNLLKQPVIARDQSKFFAEIADEVLHRGIEYKLTAAQLDAIYRTVHSRVSIITGGAGTGKTSTVRGLLNVLTAINGWPKTGKPANSASVANHTVIMAAPTNKAARRLTQQTKLPATSIHKLMGAVPASKKDSVYGTGFVFDKYSGNPLSDTTVILDEASMIDARLFAAVIDALSPNCRLVLLGDHHQLPPVSEGNPMLDLLEWVPTSNLTKILRSDPGQMQVNQMAIRENQFDRVNMKKAPDWEFVACDSDDDIMNTVISLGLRLHKEHGPYGFQIISPRKAGHALSTYEINKRFRTELFVTNNIALVKGDKGIATAGVSDAEMVNGDMFMVTDVNESAGVMTIEKELRSPNEPPTRTVRRYEESLECGWALTVHKYQGCETDVVVVVAAASFGSFMTKNMTYTAITRAKKKVIIVGQRSAFMESLNRPEPPRNTLLGYVTAHCLPHAMEAATDIIDFEPGESRRSPDLGHPGDIGG